MIIAKQFHRDVKVKPCNFDTFLYGSLFCTHPNRQIGIKRINDLGAFTYEANEALLAAESTLLDVFSGKHDHLPQEVKQDSRLHL